MLFHLNKKDKNVGIGRCTCTILYKRKCTRIPVKRRGVVLFLGPVPPLLFQGKIWPRSETLWVSLLEPLGPKPNGAN